MFLVLRLVDLCLPSYSSSKIGTMIVLPQSLGNSPIFLLFLKIIANGLWILTTFLSTEYKYIELLTVLSM